MAQLVHVTMENTYQYLGMDFDGFDDITDFLNFNLQMSRNADEYKTDVESVLKEARDLAKQFVESDHPVNPYSRYQTTHKLADSIKYDTRTFGSGTGGRLFADATDNLGRKYAGHIEYGFTDKRGIPHGPWPFLRPAMRMAAEASKRNFADSMAQIATYGFTTGSKIKIGARNASQQIQEAGGRGSVINVSKRTYAADGKSGTRWHEAANGIGHMSGVHYGNRASNSEYRWGSL